MACFSADGPKPLNYGDILRQTLQTQVGLQPLLQASQAQFAPMQTNLALGNMNDLLFGSGEQSYDVQTFTPAVFQNGRNISYGKAPKGFMGEVVTPTLPYWGDLGDGKKGWITPGGGTAPGATGSTIAGVGSTVTPRNRTSGSDGINSTQLMLDPGGAIAGALPVNPLDPAGLLPFNPIDPFGVFGGGSDRVRIAGPQYGTRTVTQGAQRGLIDLMNQAAYETQSADISRLTDLGPEARNAVLAANPEMAAMLQEMSRQAMEGLQAGTNLTPEEQRLMQQAARGAWAARGLGGSDASAADEVLRQFALGQDLQGRRRGYASSVLGQEQALVQNPVLQLILRQNSAVPQAQGMMPGQLFNPESPFAGNIAAANQQMAAMFADPSTLDKINQVTQTTGNVLGTVTQLAGGFMGGI